MGNKNDNIQIFILEQMRKRNTPTQKYKDVFQKLPEQPKILINNQAGQGSLTVLKEINYAEKTLQNERDELLRARQEMRIRISEQIEIRKRRIEQHKAEIIYLKKKCTALQTSLGTPENK